jgi:hypothetical protein
MFPVIYFKEANNILIYFFTFSYTYVTSLLSQQVTPASDATTNRRVTCASDIQTKGQNRTIDYFIFIS